MRLVRAIAVGLALASCSGQSAVGAQARSQRPSSAESDAYMRKAEAEWTQLFVKDESALLEHILADEFTGSFTYGAVDDKAHSVSSAKPDGSFKSAKLDYVNYHHFGDTVVAQGAESAQRSDGGPDLILIWTDVWLWRNGKWQIVASHVSTPPGRK